MCVCMHARMRARLHTCLCKHTVHTLTCIHACTAACNVPVLELHIIMFSAFINCVYIHICQDMEPKIAKVSEEVLKTLAEGDVKIAHLLARIEKDEVLVTVVSFQVAVLWIGSACCYLPVGK